jgi:hypothetical protein
VLEAVIAKTASAYRRREPKPDCGTVAEKRALYDELY